MSVKKLGTKIIIARILLVLVIFGGTLTSLHIAEPMIMAVYNRIIGSKHLPGEIFTEKDVEFTLVPDNMFIDNWSSSGSYDGDFVCGDTHFKHGIGMYIPSKRIYYGGTGSAKFSVNLDGQFNQLYFDLCTDSVWTAGENSGTYRVICYIDGQLVYDTGFNNYQYREEILLDVENAGELTVELQEKKGSGGTLNVIFGEFELNKIKK